MRGEYDLVEDIRIKHDSLIGKSLIRRVIGFMIFLIFCAVFFSSIYLFSLDKIEKSEANVIEDDKNNSHKTLYIEQKLRKDLERMAKTTK